MRVGTILNTFKIVPKIVHDIQFPKTFPKHPKVSRKIADNSLYIFGKLLSDINAGRQLPPEQLLSMFELEAQIQELRDAGAEHFELTADLIFLRPEVTEWWRRKMPYLSKLRKEENVTFSVHLPQFGGVQINSYLPEIKQASLDVIKRTADFFAPLEPTGFAMHLGGERFFRYLSMHSIGPVLSQELNKMFPKSWWGKTKKQSLYQFIRLLIWWIKHHVNDTVSVPAILESLEEIKKIVPLEKICLENLEHSDFEMMADMVTKKKNVKICFDVGHLALQSGIKDAPRFIQKYNRKIGQLHLHDIAVIAATIYPNGEKELVLQDHKPLGAGLLNLKEDILLPLKKIDFRGPIIIEDYYHDPVPSVKMLKQAIEEIRNTPK